MQEEGDYSDGGEVDNVDLDEVLEGDHKEQEREEEDSCDDVTRGCGTHWTN